LPYTLKVVLTTLTLPCECDSVGVVVTSVVHQKLKNKTICMHKSLVLFFWFSVNVVFYCHLVVALSLHVD